MPQMTHICPWECGPQTPRPALTTHPLQHEREFIEKYFRMIQVYLCSNQLILWLYGTGDRWCQIPMLGLVMSIKSTKLDRRLHFCKGWRWPLFVVSPLARPSVTKISLSQNSTFHGIFGTIIWRETCYRLGPGTVSFGIEWMTVSCQYGEPHVKVKMVSRPSYL